MEQPIQSWHSAEQGSTIGKEGSEAGIIVLDEEHPDGARISLERETTVAPFAITCGIYGWFFHTRYFGDEAAAKCDFGAMKAALEEILEGLGDRDSDEEHVRARTMCAIEAFVGRFPT